MLNRENEVDTVIMSFAIVQSGDDISGETLVTIMDAGGKEYSRNAGRGGNRCIKKAHENSFYIEASPTSYFEVSLKHYPQLSGSYFEKGRFIGKVELRKTSL